MCGLWRFKWVCAFDQSRQNLPCSHIQKWFRRRFIPKYSPLAPLDSYVTMLRMCDKYRNLMGWLSREKMYLTVSFLFLIVVSLLNSLATSVVCWYLLLIVWTQIRHDKMSDLIWIKTVWHSCRIPEGIYRKNDFEKKIRRRQKQAKLPSKQRIEHFSWSIWIKGQYVR